MKGVESRFFIEVDASIYRSGRERFWVFMKVDTNSFDGEVEM